MVDDRARGDAWSSSNRAANIIQKLYSRAVYKLVRIHWIVDWKSLKIQKIRSLLVTHDHMPGLKVKRDSCVRLLVQPLS